MKQTDRPLILLPSEGHQTKTGGSRGLQYTDDARRGSGLPAELIDHAGTRKEERCMSLYLLVVTVIRVYSILTVVVSGYLRYLLKVDSKVPGSFQGHNKSPYLTEYIHGTY